MRDDRIPAVFIVDDPPVNAAYFLGKQKQDFGLLPWPGPCPACGFVGVRANPPGASYPDVTSALTSLQSKQKKMPIVPQRKNGSVFMCGSCDGHPAGRGLLNLAFSRGQAARATTIIRVLC